MSVLYVVSAIKLYEFSILRESIHELSQRCHKINKFPKSRAGGINKRTAGLNSGPRATGFTGRTPAYKLSQHHFPLELSDVFISVS